MPALLATLLALGCHPPVPTVPPVAPAWVPSDDTAAPFLCGDGLDDACSPEGLWVVGHASLLDTWESDEPLLADCPDGSVSIVRTACGWSHREIHVADVLRGAPVSGPLVALGILSGEKYESCSPIARPELDGPYLFLLTPGDGRYMIEAAYRIVPNHAGLPAVRAGLAEALGVEEHWPSVSKYSDALIPLDWLRQEGIARACS